jgi:hypothetical protein
MRYRGGGVGHKYMREVENLFEDARREQPDLVEEPQATASTGNMPTIGGGGGCCAEERDPEGKRTCIDFEDEQMDVDPENEWTDENEQTAIDPEESNRTSEEESDYLNEEDGDYGNVDYGEISQGTYGMGEY